MSTNDAPSSSIEWHDSPKFVPDNVGTLRSKLPQVKRLESEQKFNAEFDKWFGMGDEMNEASSSRPSTGTANEDIDVTPPVLRIRCGALRPQSSGVSSYSAARFANNDSDIDEASGLTDVLKEAKKTIRRLIEKKRHSSSGSLSSGTDSPYSGPVKRSAFVAEGESTAHASNHFKKESHVSEVEAEVEITRKSDRRSECQLESALVGPCTSTQIDTPIGAAVSRRFNHFGSDDQEPSPITSLGSRKRRRNSQPEVVLRKGDDMELNMSSDEDIGPVESTPLSSHRVLVVRDRNEGASTLNSTIAGKNEEDSSSYDSMDDETVNVLLSQMPIEPVRYPPDTEVHTTGTLGSNDARTLPGKTTATSSFKKDAFAPSKAKICVTKKVQATKKSHNERTPLRRWRTSDASPQADMKTGGWSRRMTAITAGGSGATVEKAIDEGEEVIPRSASLEPQKRDSFWDDDEFEGIDFSAIDAVQ